MSKELFPKEIESSQKNVSIRVVNEAQKSLASFFGVKKASVRFTTSEINGPWKLNIDGSNDLGIRMHSTGALEVSKTTKDGEITWDRVSSSDQLVDIYYEKNKSKDSFEVKFNKKKFVPNEFILKQTQFIGEEKAPNKSFWKKAKEWGRNLVREATHDQNMIGFLAGGAAVILLNTLAEGNTSVAHTLKECLSHAFKYTSSASALLTAAHPILYLLETRSGKKFYKDLRRVTNFLAMAHFGALGTTMATDALQDQEESKLGTGNSIHQIENETKNEQLDRSSKSMSGVDLDQNSNSTETQQTPLYATSDVHFNTILSEHYSTQEGDTVWINQENDVTLVNVLTEQTWEDLKDNKFNLREIDLNDFKSHPEDYLTSDQMKELQKISNTNNVGEYIDLIK